MTRLAVICWIILNSLVVIGGSIGWFQLRSNDKRVSKYLRRLLAADALCGVVFLIATARIPRAVSVAPVFSIFPFVVAALLVGAVWGWLFYGAGYLNGGGWRGVVKRLFNPERRTTMVDEHKDEDKDESPAPASAKPEQPGKGTGPSPTGVVDGPGKSGDNPPPEQP